MEGILLENAEHSSIKCKNCEKSVDTKFCPDCGQKTKTKRITTLNLLNDLRQQFIHIDSGYFYTCWQLATKPGHMVESYIAGHRINHFKPLKFLFWSVGASFVVFHAIGMDKLFMENMAKTSSSDLTPGLTEKLMQNPMVIVLMMLPQMALFSWLLYRKKGYNYAEHVVADAYFFGFISLIGIIPNIIFKIMHDHFQTNLISYQTSFGLLTWLIYLVWAFHQLFKPKNPIIGLFKTLGVLSFSYILTIVFVAILVAIGMFFFKEQMNELMHAPVAK